MSLDILKVENLSVAEKAALYHLLENDAEVIEYVQAENEESGLFEEISKRDKAYSTGKIKLTSIEDLESRLQAVK